MPRERKYTTAWDAETEIFEKRFVDGTKLEVDVSKLPEVSRQFVLGYGITQIMNDRHSGETEVAEIIKISQQTAEDLMNGVLRRRAAGTGIGVNLDLLCKALANAEAEIESPEQARELLSKFLPEDDDDEDTIKQKKARIRAIKNYGPVKAEMDRLQGKVNPLLAGA